MLGRLGLSLEELHSPEVAGGRHRLVEHLHVLARLLQGHACGRRASTGRARRPPRLARVRSGTPPRRSPTGTTRPAAPGLRLRAAPGRRHRAAANEPRSSCCDRRPYVLRLSAPRGLTPGSVCHAPPTAISIWPASDSLLRAHPRRDRSTGRSSSELDPILALEHDRHWRVQPSGRHRRARLRSPQPGDVSRHRRWSSGWLPLAACPHA